jgi:hypothetical protein
MKNGLFSIIVVTSALLVTACSESSGLDSTSTASTTVPTVVSPVTVQTYPLKTAYTTAFNDSSTLPFTASGVVMGVPVSGSGTLTQDAVIGGFFEGGPALVKQSSLAGSATGTNNGLPVVQPIAAVMIEYNDPGNNPLGQQGALYSVVNGVVNLPLKVAVNDSGLMFTYQNYANSLKLLATGATEVSYLIEADTPTTALLNLITTQKDTGNIVTLTSRTQYRMTITGGLTRLSDTLTQGADTLTLVY